MNGCHAQIGSMPTIRLIAPNAAWAPAGYEIPTIFATTPRYDESWFAGTMWPLCCK